MASSRVTAPDALGAVAEDAVLVEQALEIVDRRGQLLVDHPLHELDEGVLIGQVGHGPAQPRPVGVEALAREVVHHVHDPLALVEPVDEAGEGPQVQGGGADAQQVVLDAAQFAKDRADGLAARGDVDVEELLGAVVPGDVVDDRRDVVQPRGDGDVLVVVQRLGELLEARVQVADVRHRPHDPLAVELHHDAERRVRRGVLGAEVERPAVAASAPALRVHVGRGLGINIQGLEVVGHGRRVRFGGAGSAPIVRSPPRPAQRYDPPCSSGCGKPGGGGGGSARWATRPRPGRRGCRCGGW